jgi:hypothetical protein
MQCGRESGHLVRKKLDHVVVRGVWGRRKRHRSGFFLVVRCRKTILKMNSSGVNKVLEVIYSSDEGSISEVYEPWMEIVLSFTMSHNSVAVMIIPEHVM